MTIGQVKNYFVDKENVPCPLTEKLVGAGYQQISGGYIDRARRVGLLVDYTKNQPSQYWHLMSFCDRRDPSKPFGRSVVCGELIFWMAETSQSVPSEVLKGLVDSIITSVDHHESSRPLFDRVKWNRQIQRVCFEHIASKVERFNL